MNRHKKIMILSFVIVMVLLLDVVISLDYLSIISYPKGIVILVKHLIILDLLLKKISLLII